MRAPCCLPPSPWAPCWPAARRRPPNAYVASTSAGRGSALGTTSAAIAANSWPAAVAVTCGAATGVRPVPASAAPRRESRRRQRRRDGLGGRLSCAAPRSIRILGECPARLAECRDGQWRLAGLPADRDHRWHRLAGRWRGGGAAGGGAGDRHRLRPGHRRGGGEYPGVPDRRAARRSRPCRCGARRRGRAGCRRTYNSFHAGDANRGRAISPASGPPP